MALYQLLMPYGKFPGQYLPDHWAVDYNPALGELLDYGDYIKRTPSLAVYRMDNGVDLEISGKNLVYKNGDVAGGAITSLVLRDAEDHGVIQTINGLNWSGASFYKTVNVGQSWFTASVCLQGNDRLVGSAGKDELWAFAGNDTLIGGTGGDNLVGGRGRDTYDGGGGPGDVDQLSFDDAYDDKTGAHGVTVDIGAGSAIDPWGNKEIFKNIERIKGTQFADKLVGSSGDDQFRPLGGNDWIDGKGGHDMIRYDRDAQKGSRIGVEVDLGKGYGRDGFGNRDTLKNIEDAVGTVYADKLNGSTASNLLMGDSGADQLYGGRGADQLYGGGGSDVFVYKTLADTTVAKSGRDVLYDLDTSDTIDLHMIDANTKISGNQDFTWIGASVFHGKTGELRYETSAGKTFVSGDVDGDKAADFRIELYGSHKLSSQNFDL